MTSPGFTDIKPDASCSGMPDRLLDYVLAAQPLHDAMRRALIHLAGYVLKASTYPQGTIVEDGFVERARLDLAEAVDGLRSLGIPAGAAHHHLHLSGAAEALGAGIACVFGRDGAARERLHHALDEANRHIRAAGTCLPGFAPVDLTQACCAAHRPLVSEGAVLLGDTSLDGRGHGKVFDLGA
ncbi:MAG: hypothetical protein AB7F76_01495 [Parvibaculaceae bacterium]